MNYRNHITIDPNNRSGEPCVGGLPITVYEVLECLASELTQKEILEKLPDLTQEDLKACIAYAADLIKKMTSLSKSQELQSLLDFFSLENQVSSALISAQDKSTDFIPTNNPTISEDISSEDIRSKADRLLKRDFILRTFAERVINSCQADVEEDEEVIIFREEMRRFIEDLDNFYKKFKK
jgi:uncharacterized protein (DUF433 family)